MAATARHEDDDGFDDFLSDGEEDATLFEQEAAAAERRLKTIGIRDGLEFGKQDTLQEGFDAGFAAGAARSCRFGVLRGALSAALVCGLFNSATEETKAEAASCAAELRSLAMEAATAPSTEAVIADQAMDDERAKAASTKAHELLESIQVQVSLDYLHQ